MGRPSEIERFLLFTSALKRLVAREKIRSAETCTLFDEDSVLPIFLLPDSLLIYFWKLSPQAAT